MRRPLCFLCLAFAAVLILCKRCMPMPDYGSLDGRQIAAEGRVYRKEYKERADSGAIPVIYLKSVHILENSEYSKRNSSEQNPISEIKNIVCYMERDGYREPELGTAVRLEGKVRCFARAGNPGEFDMQNYYDTMKISFRLDNAHMTASGGEFWHVRERLYQLKQYFARALENVFPPKDASVMKAILLGEKNGLDAETKELYRQSSIIHILSISGLHISMIGMGLYQCLRKIGILKKGAAAVGIGIILCYGMMTGMSMSAVRAMIMFILHLLADALGRTYDMATALALAAVLLLAEQPGYAFHSGFLFSFGAAASLGLLPAVLQEEKNPAEKGYHDKRKIRHLERILGKIKQSAVSGISVTLGTLPVHFWFYYQFPVYSILLNLLVIPLMAIVMGGGLFCMVAGGAAPGMARGVSWICRAVLWVYEQSCRLGEKISGGLLVRGRPEGWQIASYLLLLILLAVYVYRHPGELSFFWKCQWVMAGLCILLLRTGDGFHVTMLDVGQGDCIHIRSGEGKDYLIDGGSSTKKEVMEYQILPYLKFMGVRHLQAVFVTHADEDHCGGVIELLEEYPVRGLTIGSLVLPDIGRKSADEQYRKMEELAVQKGIRLQYIGRGQRMEDGDMNLACIHPLAGYETEERNAYSMVLFLEYKNFTGLFTGDLEGDGEEMACAYMKEQKRTGSLTLLKVAHHGSAYSTGREMLEMLSPKLAFISCGANNRYGHPHEELLERLEEEGSRIYATPEHGAVTACWIKGRVGIRCFRP